MYGVTDLCVLTGHLLRAVVDDAGRWCGYRCERCGMVDTQPPRRGGKETDDGD